MDPKAVLNTTWRSLVQRRLLPVAILLVAALAAIPVLLSKSPAPAAPVPVPHSDEATKTAATADPIVTLTSDTDAAKRRRVLGVRKNPFAPAPVHLKAAKTATSVSASPSASSGGSSSGSGSSSSPSSSASAPASGGSGGSTTVSDPGTSAPTTDAPATAPKKTYPVYSLTVRFGDSTAESLNKVTLSRLKPLPSAVDPRLVYLGLSKDGKSAVFLLDASLSAQGDGTCEPNPANCQTLRLRQGETEFFDVTPDSGGSADSSAAQYELDIVKIHKGSTASAAKAAAAHAKASPAGQEILKARQADAGPLRYRYNAKAGTLSRLGMKAWKATVRAAAALKAHL
jgi:hypothetical protein